MVCVAGAGRPAPRSCDPGNESTARSRSRRLRARRRPAAPRRWRLIQSCSSGQRPSPGSAGDSRASPGQRFHRGWPAWPRPGIVDTSAGGYRLTESGLALSGVIRELARWATVADAAALTAEDIDTAALTWDIQRRINVEALPGLLVVLEIEFTVIMEHRRRWWSGRAGGSGSTRRAVSPSLRSGDRTGRSAWAARAPGRRRTPHDRLRPRGGRSGRRSPGRSHLGSRVPWSSPRYRVARRPCNCFTGAGGLPLVVEAGQMPVVDRG